MYHRNLKCGLEVDVHLVGLGYTTGVELKNSTDCKMLETDRLDGVIDNGTLLGGAGDPELDVGADDFLPTMVSMEQDGSVGDNFA